MAKQDDVLENEFTDVDAFLEFAQARTDIRILRGMLKDDPENINVILYAPLECDAWIEVEKSAVEKIRFFGHKQCMLGEGETHTHPMVEIENNTKKTKSAGPLEIVSKFNTRLGKLLRQSVKAEDAKPQNSYIGPCNSAYECPDGSVIYCTNSRPYVDYNTGYCECIRC